MCNYKLINPETGKLDRSKYMARVWQWKKAGKRQETAHKQVQDEVADEKFKLNWSKMNHSTNADKDMSKVSLENRSYWTSGNRLSVL